MEPITTYFDSIDRVGIGVIKKEPFKNWLKSIYPETTEKELSDNNVYMIDEDRVAGGLGLWLSANYQDIFSNELNEWTTDQKTWPDNRTYLLFQQWFKVEFFGVIYDLEDESDV